MQALRFWRRSTNAPDFSLRPPPSSRERLGRAAWNLNLQAPARHHPTSLNGGEAPRLVGQSAAMFCARLQSMSAQLLVPWPSLLSGQCRRSAEYLIAGMRRFKSGRAPHCRIPVRCPDAVTGTWARRPAQHACTERDAEPSAQCTKMRFWRFEKFPGIDDRRCAAQSLGHFIEQLRFLLQADVGRGHVRT